MCSRHAQVSGVLCAPDALATVQAACAELRAGAVADGERARRGRASRSSTTRLRGSRPHRRTTCRHAGDDVRVHLHLGHDRLPEGRDAQPAQHRCWPGEGFVERMYLQPDDRLLCILPMFHVNAICYSLSGTLAAGATLVLEPRFSASPVLANRARNGRDRGQHDRRGHEHPDASTSQRVRARAPVAQALRRAVLRGGVPRLQRRVPRADADRGLRDVGDARRAQQSFSRPAPDWKHGQAEPSSRPCNALLRTEDRRRQRTRRPGRRDRRARRAHADRDARLLPRTGDDRRRVPRRLVPDRRPCAPRRRWLLLVRRPQEGHHSQARREHLRRRTRPCGRQSSRGDGGGRHSRSIADSARTTSWSSWCANPMRR